MLVDTPPSAFGWTAPDFTLPDADGKTHKLSDCAGPGGVVVAFICNHCPYVKAIADRLAQDAAALSDAGVWIVGVMSNDYVAYPSDSPAAMKDFAARHGFRFPYLVDEDQAIARHFDAVCTPDFFGLASDLTLRYRGRLDSTGMRGTDGRVPELVQAMTQIAQTGQGPEVQHPSMGCSIKWRRG